MAQWKQTLEPYVKVIETVKQMAVNPTAGEDLIIGAVLLSDAGPSIPTLITSQKEFLKAYAAEDLSETYTDSLNDLYTGDNKTLASTMWLNAYRLAGAGNLLISRASKSDGFVYAKDLLNTTGNNDEYLIKESEVLKKVSPFKFVIDNGVYMNSLTGQEIDIAEVSGAGDGWALSIKDVGVIGNRVNDNGPLYDYYVDNLYDLVQKLNETSKFFTPEYYFYSDEKCLEENKLDIDDSSSAAEKREAKSVVFETVYLAGDGIMEPEVTDSEGNVEYWGYDSEGPNSENYYGEHTEDGGSVTAAENVSGNHKNNWGDLDHHNHQVDIDSTAVGCAYIIPATVSYSDASQTIINLNSSSYSGYKTPEYFASNLYNSRVDIKVRIRRFNHNAVQQIVLEEGSNESPYNVLTSVLDVYTKKGKKNNNIEDSIKKYDFYEVAVLDPGISSEWQLFNIGNVPGRGDITIADLNNSLSMLHLTLPLDLSELGLNYYGYKTDDYKYDAESDEFTTEKNGLSSIDGLNVKIEKGNALLCAGNAEIMKAWDKIEEDERYIVEGMTDLGCTETIIQNYMANIAVNSNYFYAASTVNSTNYMIIANKKSKIVNDSKKVYFLAPWDYDDGTVGYLFNCSPSVIYWETIYKNRGNNQEFAAAFGQNTGVVTVVNLAKDFKKSERQLLLTKKINTIFHDLYLERYYINDNYTNQTDDDVMKEECNSRLMIRISKAMPLLLNQFKGRQCTTKTFQDAEDVIHYWFKTVVLTYGSTIADYQVNIVNNELNDDAAARANKMYVTINVRYLNSIKYITVYHNAYPVGLEFGE